jgi:cysteine-rich repeat protein
VPACDPPDPDCQGFCGDGIVQPGELCDDGNGVDGDGCEHDCTPSCGNGKVDPGEECDDGNGDETDGCRHCLLPFCGDGVVDPGEECDDGNDADGDGCDASCKLETPGGGGCSVGGDGPGGGLLLVLLLVIRLAAQNRVRPVELLEEDDAREPVGQGDAPKGEPPVGACLDRGGEPLGAADGEGEGRAAAVLLGGPDDLRRDLLAGEELAGGIEGDEASAVGQGGEEGGVVAHLLHRERGVVLEAAEILGFGRLEVRLLQATDGEDDDLQ